MNSSYQKPDQKQTYLKEVDLSCAPLGLLAVQFSTHPPHFFFFLKKKKATPTMGGTQNASPQV